MNKIEASTQTSYPVYTPMTITACAVDWDNRKVRAVRAECDPYNDLVGLEFKSCEMTMEKVEEIIKGKDSFKGIGKVHWANCLESFILEKCSPVKKALINLTLPPSALYEDRLWLVCIPVVSVACQSYFPQMLPEKSAFNYQIGFQQYSADKHLYEGMDTNIELKTR